MPAAKTQTKGLVFDIQRFSIHDGPGIRTIVFLKGCTLNCRWCANPESINTERDLGFMQARCDACGKCVNACPLQAISLDDKGKPIIDRRKCNKCGDCAAVCFPKALILYGTEMTPAEVLEEVRRDQIFYDGSGGGVTASGGEPLRQAPFLKELFTLCHQAGIHTAIETSGFVSGRVLRELLALIDYILFDLKHMDTEIHRAYTNRPNDLILANARIAAASGKSLLFRNPLIPGVNDTPENIKATAAFIREVQGSKAALELIPYHRFGLSKYKAIDVPYSLESTKSPEPAQVEAVQRTYESLGVKCIISK